MNYQTISRVIFLCFVIIAAVYFMIINKQPVKVERFEQASSPAAAPAPARVTPPVPSNYDPDSLVESMDTEVNMQIIKDLFESNFKRQPSRKEVEFYIDYISTRKISISQLNAIIAGNNKVLRDTFKNTDSVGYQYKASDPVLGTEDEVIETFNEILYRNPDYAELRYYAKKLKDDPNFTLDKLKQLLVTSAEYSRLEKTQNNMAYADNLGNVTDRQVSLVITTIYKEEAKDDIDDDTLRFLKKRYVEFQMDDETLRKFIRQYITFQKDFEKEIRDSAPTGVGKASDPFGATLSRNKQSSSRSTKSTTKTTNSSTDADTEEDTDTFTSDNKPNKELIKKLETLYQTEDDSDYLNSSKVIKTLMQNGDEECQADLNKDALEKRLEAMDKQLLAKLVYDRNMDHMKNVCRRNQKYINADQDMVLFPEYKWSVPQKFPPVCTPLEKNEYQPLIDQSSLIGTLLGDADKTKVGSILPKNPPY